MRRRNRDIEKDVFEFTLAIIVALAAGSVKGTRAGAAIQSDNGSLIEPGMS
jgi:hypothetical protein